MLIILFLIAFMMGYWRMTPAILVPRHRRPPVLNQKHDDWPWIFRHIPRYLNALISDKPPIKLLGNAKSVKPIPDPGEWALFFPPSFTIHTRSRRMLRLSILRWDNVEGYYTGPSAAYRKDY